MKQNVHSPLDSMLGQYPVLRTRCEGRAALNGEAASIEDGIADAVNGAIKLGEGPHVAAMIKHLATAFLFAQALKQKV
jgi:hypothetical protein